MHIADILIDVHSDLASSERADVEHALSECDGVVSAHFGPGSRHGLVVAYDPQAISASRILGWVRAWDANATMAGL